VGVLELQGRGKREEGRGKREEGRGKREEAGDFFARLFLFGELVELCCIFVSVRYIPLRYDN
jgi:hypothetical protein